MGSQASKISTPVYTVDSAEELKLGVGRLFEQKNIIGEREAIVSAHNLKVLQAEVGDTIPMHYDFMLILNMV